MKTASMSKGATPENYVGELRLRSPVSSQVYLSILNGFQRFVAEQAEDKSVSQATIRQWLKDSARTTGVVVRCPYSILKSANGLLASALLFTLQSKKRSTRRARSVTMWNGHTRIRC
jgi:hypothetical protein